jgi:hypothetical protein
MKKFFGALALLLSHGTVLAAQTVGSLPDKSPFLDLSDGMRFGVVAGWLATGHDAVGVNPKSAPIVGVRYDWAVGGPVFLTSSLFATNTTRPVLDYAHSAATRNIGNQSTGLLVFNVGVAMSLTGERSWHHFQPLIDLGVGVATGPGDKEDISGYAFGNRFSFSYGFGVRYVTGKNIEFRADLNQYWWQLKYPELYRSTQGDPVAIKPNGSLDSYTANTALTIGATIRIFR